MGKSRETSKQQVTSIKTIENLKHSTESFECRLCNKKFRSPTTLQRHMNLHPDTDQAEHSEDAGDLLKDSKFNCPKCPKSYLKKRSLEKHMASHEVTKQNIISKNIIHQDSYPYECTDCWECFSEKSYLLAHKNLHSNSTVLLNCKKCNASFPHKSALNRHLLTHTSEKPYKCIFCNATFDDVSARSKHAKVHIVFCGMCHSSFKNLDEFRDHVVQVHRIKNLTLSKDITETSTANATKSAGDNSSENEDEEMSSSLEDEEFDSNDETSVLEKQKSVSCENNNSVSGPIDKNQLLSKSKTLFRYMCGSPNCNSVYFETEEALSQHIADKHKVIVKCNKKSTSSKHDEKTCAGQIQVEAKESNSTIPNLPLPPLNFSLQDPTGAVLNSGVIQGNISSSMNQGNIFCPNMGVGSSTLPSGNLSNSGLIMLELPNKPATYQIPNQVLSYQSPQNFLPNPMFNPLTATGFTQQYIDPATAYMGFDIESYIRWFQSFCEMCKSLQYPLEFHLYEKLTHCIKCISNMIANPMNKLKERDNFTILMQLYQEMSKVADGHIKHVAKDIFK